MEYSYVRLPEYSEIATMRYMFALFLAVLYVGLFMMLTRDVILSLRPNSGTLDRSTRRMVTRLGCARPEFCYRGRRAGKHVQSRCSRSVYKHWVFHSNESRHPAKTIPVVVAHRPSTPSTARHQLHQTCCGSRSSRSHPPACQQGQSALINCLTVVPECSRVRESSERLSVITLNAHSLVKNNAFQALTAEVLTV